MIERHCCWLGCAEVPLRREPVGRCSDCLSWSVGFYVVCACFGFGVRYLVEFADEDKDLAGTPTGRFFNFKVAVSVCRRVNLLLNLSVESVCNATTCSIIRVVASPAKVIPRVSFEYLFHRFPLLHPHLSSPS